MKKVNVLWSVLALILVFSFTVSAASFQVDGSYLFGSGEFGALKSKSRGFALHGSVELMPNVLADGSFVSLSYTELGTEKITSALPEKFLKESVITAGGLYRVVSDSDLQVFIGAGLANFSSALGKTDPLIAKGKGIYGKFGLNFEPMEKVNLMADLSYAPKFKIEEQDGNFLAARATISYAVMTDISLQGTAKYYKVGTDSSNVSTNTMLGGGVVFSF